MPLLPVILVGTGLTLLGLVFGFDRDLVVFALLGLGAAVFGVYLGQRRLRAEISELRQKLAALEPGPLTGTATPPVESEPAQSYNAIPGTEADAAEPAMTAAAGITEPTAADSAQSWSQSASIQARPVVTPEESEKLPPRAPNAVDRFENLVRAGGKLVTSYFTDGNLFVRIGILVLFVGVAFLLRYAAENSAIPLEFRFAGAALGGMVLLGFGWRLRKRKAVYALLLQGAGIGVTYLTIFAAFRLANLLPPTLTFILLLVFAALTVALALLQNSRALAVFAVLGGFLAPLLASSGSGNYIGLFSYYAVLNAAVLTLAWYRAWRLLNLLGFAFTFGVFTLWMLTDYRDAYLFPALGFLLLFLLMYSQIGILYALRQPQKMTGLVDGSLVFGTPVVASSLAMAMLHEREFGIALACAGLGVYYLGLAVFSWRRIGEDLRLMAEALLAIGVVFATLAIPYALDSEWSSAAWALEAAGILWVSLRQRRIYAQCFAMALQLAAGLLFLESFDISAQASPWLNQAFFGGVFIALGGLISARLLYLQEASSKLRLAHLLFFPWGLGWWLFSVIAQIETFNYPWIPSLLTLFTLTALVLFYCDRLRGWDWRPASIGAGLFLPLLVVIGALAQIDHGHLLRSPDSYFWIAAIVASYWITTRLETVSWPGWINIAGHTLFVSFVALSLSTELYWQLDRRLLAFGEGFEALLALAPLLALQLSISGRFPAIKRLGEPLRWTMAGTLSALLIIWCVGVNLSNSGDAEPLPFLPIMNPLDLANIALFLLLLGGLRRLPDTWSEQRRQVRIVLSGLAFLWLTALLIRSLHHFLDLPFDLDFLLGDTRVQTAISILWTIIGIGAMWTASQRQQRPVWIAGAALVGIVLVKMLLVDLGASGTIERIVSFLVVGTLLVGTGYFSPIPPRPAETPSTREESNHA